MAIRDVNEYIKTVEKQYFEMLQTMKEFEEEVKNNKCDPDLFDRLKQAILPVQSNYQRVMYIMILLNKPKSHKSNCSKIYEKRYKDTIEYLTVSGADIKSVEKENEDVLHNIRILADNMKKRGDKK